MRNAKHNLDLCRNKRDWKKYFESGTICKKENSYKRQRKLTSSFNQRVFSNQSAPHSDLKRPYVRPKF